MTINPFILHGEEVTPVRKLLYLKAFAGGGALSEYELTGNPVAFNTNIAKALTGFTIPFLPVQSGTGDPSPENVRPISGWTGVTAWRTGANLLNYNLIVDLEIAGFTGTRKGVAFTKPGTYYLKSFSEWDTDTYIYAIVKNADGTFGSIQYFIATRNVLNKTITITDGQTLYLFNASSGIYGTTEATIERLDGWEVSVSFDDVSAYAPYTGASYPVTFPATGKNLIHPTPYGGQLFNVQVGTDLAQTTVRASSEESGNTITVTVTYQWYGVVYSTDMLPPGTYNIHLEPGDEHCRVSSYVADKDFIALSRNSILSNNKEITLTETARIVVTISNDNSEPGSVTLTNLQVESGDSYTAWEPFTNTVYGGTLDAVNWVLTVTHIILTRHKSDFGNEQTGEIDYRNLMLMESVPKPSSGVSWNKARETQCLNCGKIANPYSETTYGNYIGVMLYAQLTGVIFRISSPLYDALSDDDEITICYEIAEPYEIPLSDIPVPVTLIGDNTIWTDTNGENTIRYKKKG